MQRLLGLLIVMLAIVTVFTSCDMRDQDLRGKVTFTEDSEGHRSLTYQDITYYYDEKEFFFCHGRSAYHPRWGRHGWMERYGYPVVLRT